MTMTAIAGAPACPVPFAADGCVQLGHGSGGTMSAALLRERIMPPIQNDVLARMGDAAVLSYGSAQLALTIDCHVVAPLEFPGGDIGSLAVHGTCNDLAMMGARPMVLTVGLVIEEGLPFDVLDRVMASLGAAAKAARVAVVAGDTKVVERGKADGMFITTAGMGALDPDFHPAPDRARPGDAVLVTGPIGRHGIAIMAAREGLGFEADITSDSANLWPLVSRLHAPCGGAVHAMRDPTRGGLASALTEIAHSSHVGIVLEEEALPVPAAVAAACEMLGLDPLYVANEGVALMFVAANHAETALRVLRAHPLGVAATRIGTVVEPHPGLVVLRTAIGGTRIVDMLPGDQLPRIC